METDLDLSEELFEKHYLEPGMAPEYPIDFLSLSKGGMPDPYKKDFDCFFINENGNPEIQKQQDYAIFPIIQIKSDFFSATGSDKENLDKLAIEDLRKQKNKSICRLLQFASEHSKNTCCSYGHFYNSPLLYAIESALSSFKASHIAMNTKLYKEVFKKIVGQNKTARGHIKTVVKGEKITIFPSDEVDMAVLIDTSRNGLINPCTQDDFCWQAYRLRWENESVAWTDCNYAILGSDLVVRAT